jgi:CheY-like chemotaxis protein
MEEFILQDAGHRPNHQDQAARIMTQTKKGLALVVEDEPTNRMLLKALLKKRGYDVVEAENGLQAIERFHEHEPDIIFMDVMMPLMDGYEASSRIKESAGDHFIPIIFLTAMTDEKDLAKCVEAGGDDFLAKPFSFTLLSAKMKAMERIHSLNLATRALYSRMQRDEEIAEQVFSGAVVAGNVAMDQIRTLLQPASVFSGDLLLTAYAPSHDLHILLGDFTGHGLAAALGALPTSEVFRTMTAKGFAPQQILYAINNKLHDLLPGMFLAAQFVKVDFRLDHIMILNCGMPDCFVLNHKDGRIKQTITSKSLPLGITSDINFKNEIHYIPIDENDRVVLATDGVFEARNAAGEYFGEERLIQSFSACDAETYQIDRLQQDLEKFCQGAAQDDDISVAEIPLIESLLPAWEKCEISQPSSVENKKPGTLLTESHDDCIEFHLTLHGRQLRNADPIPIVINYIQETVGLHKYRRPLFTILTELYVNALDHGILNLDSKIKQGEDGFTNYFQQRESRLQTLTQGKIRIGLRIHELETGGYLVIQIEDSGPGFDFKTLESNKSEKELFSGRGILLVKSLCKELSYNTSGNQAEAVFAWNDNEE